MHQTIQTDKAPAAVGPYSQATRIDQLVFTAGQIALSPDTGAMVGEGDVAAQTEQVLANLQAVLQAAGSDLTRVLKTTVYLTTMDHLAAMNEVYTRWFSPGPFPGRTCIAVCALPKGGLVEIEAIAHTHSNSAS